MRRIPAVPAVAVALAAVLAGCGLGPGRGTSDVSITVTRDFGARLLGHVVDRRVAGAQTVMRLLERSFAVGTRYGGGFVESIDGHAGTAAHYDWFYYVNGIEASKGAAGTAVHRGDEIWWDLHDWGASESIPAVVGSFPEPFIHGTGGRRLPTALECAADASAACGTVSAELNRLDIPVANQLLGTGSGTDSLALEVGTWRDMRGQIVASLIGQGPAASGIYARFTADGSRLQLLDPRGQVVRSLGRDAGLVAATAQGSFEPIWLITGTDPAGVAAAAAALTPSALRDHFALAVGAGTRLALPLEPTR